MEYCRRGVGSGQWTVGGGQKIDSRATQRVATTIGGGNPLGRTRNDYLTHFFGTDSTFGSLAGGFSFQNSVSVGASGGADCLFATSKPYSRT